MERSDYLQQVDLAYETLRGPALTERLEALAEACGQTWGRDSQPYAAMENELGALYKGLGRLEEAEGCFRAALPLLERHLGRESAGYATALNNLAGTWRLQGRQAEAEEAFRQSLALYAAGVGQEDVDYAGILNNLSLLYLDQGRLEEADVLQRQAADLLRSLPRCRDELAVSLVNLGSLHQRLGRLDQAEAELREALALFRTELGTATPHYHAALNALGVVCYVQRRWQEAEEAFTAAAQAAQALYGPDHWEAKAALDHARRAREAMR